MMFHEFGKENDRVIVMIHGLCMSWCMLEDSIQQLATEHHVIVIAVPGMDPDEQNQFSSVERIAQDIEDGLLARGISCVDCLYGLSVDDADRAGIAVHSGTGFSSGEIRTENGG